MSRKIILLIFFFSTVHIFSQDNEIGIFAGGSNYIGDVGPTTYISPFSYNASTNYVGGVIFRKNFNERISARAKLNYSKIGSSDNWPQTADYRQQRGKWFTNKIEELSLSLEFNFREFDITSDNFQYSPYVRSGLSYFRFDDLFYPEGINQAQSFAKHNEFSIPISVGFKIKPIKSFAIGFEITANHSFSENLDGSYPKRFEDYELYSQKSFGGNLSQDWYVFTGFTLTYIFGNYECYCP